MRIKDFIRSVFVPVVYVLLYSPVTISCKTSKSNATSSLAKPIGANRVAAHHVIWGASSSPFSNEKGVEKVASWARLNDQIKSLNGGYGLDARRTYDRGIPDTWAASAMADDEGLCKVSIGSIKASWTATADGSNDVALTKFIQSIPGDRLVYLSFHHEPEDGALENKNGHSIALLQDAFARFVQVVLNAGKPNVHPCFVLMSWTFNPKSGRKPDDFNMAAKLKPEQLNKVVAGLDGYAAEPNTNSAKGIFEANFAKLASWGFTRFGIFETATHSGGTPGARAEWIKGLGEWANSRNDIELVSWFHSGIGPHAGKEGWFLGKWSVGANGTYNWWDSDGSLAAFGALLHVKNQQR